MTSLGTKLRFWRTTTAEQRETAGRILRSVVTANADSIVSLFYSVFLKHPEGATFLDNSVVQTRLAKSLREWLLDLVNLDQIETHEFERKQSRTGGVHARIGLPVYLMLEAGSLLKVEIARILSGQPDISADDKVLTLTVLDEIIDYAMRLMSASYVSDTRDRAQEEEAFRLFALGQDVNTERESQRAALMEWCQSVLFDLATGKLIAALEPLSQSAFGLWLRHRATLIFPNSSLLQGIRTTVERIDNDILPAIDSSRQGASGDMVHQIGRLQSAVDEIKFLLSDLFQSAAELEGGRDPLTRVFNRKFLASILSREMTLAKRNDLPLSIVVFDVDHFKAINDRYGHPAGDAVLRQISETLMNLARTNDFVFRYGGEEFLMVLVEADLDGAVIAAERFRRNIEAQTFTLPDKTQVKVTISAGVAPYEGHPDYEYFINAADTALLEAKRRGRNRVVSVRELAA